MGREVITEAVLNVGDVGINDGSTLFGGLLLSGLMEVLDEFLGGANGHVPAENLIGGGELLRGIFNSEDGFGVPDGEVAIGNVLLDGAPAGRGGASSWRRWPGIFRRDGR